VTDLAEPLPGVAPARVRHPARGYALYLAAAMLFAVNGTVSKTLLLGGIEASVLSQLRATAAFLILLAFVALTRPRALQLHRDELPLLLVYGILGVAMTQFLYFAAIQRMPIGVTLLIEFTAPLVIAIWFRVVWKHPTKPIVWVALVAAVGGLGVVAQIWDGLTLDPVGVAFAVGAMLALVVYYVSADMLVRGKRGRDPVSLTMWGMGAAALFWAIVRPPWTFPLDAFAGSMHLFGEGGPEVAAPVLAAWMVVLGTVMPFSLVVVSMQHLRASQASAVGMMEPIFATVIAWLVLGEVLTPVQLVGAAIVLGSVLVAELNRGTIAEDAPRPAGGTGETGETAAPDPVEAGSGARAS
jgi:drug/metabolite transporter (DMT)-like permease